MENDNGEKYHLALLENGGLITIEIPVIMSPSFISSKILGVNDIVRIFRTISLFQSKWNVWVLFELSRHQTMRFGALKKAIPAISNLMLTSTLRDLEKLGLVNVCSSMKFRSM